LPSDTAVAATTSETVNAIVAISSIAMARRLDTEFSARGVKPGLPLNSVISVILDDLSGRATIAADFGEAIEEARRFRGFWLRNR
jgi:hypothetical protein